MNTTYNILETPWQLPDVATAQVELVTQQLKNAAQGNTPAPFAAFLQAMNFVLTETHWRAPKFLDVGCGVGHYGMLLQRELPHVRYVGTDASPAMIARARLGAPKRAFLICEALKNDFQKFDIVLLAQVLEVSQSQPPLALDEILKQLPQNSFLILHRLRLGQRSHVVSEPTYLGYSAQNYVWEGPKLLRQLARFGDVRYYDVWNEYNASLVLKVGAQ